jgi:hypothetical protein
MGTEALDVVLYIIFSRDSEMIRVYGFKGPRIMCWQASQGSVLAHIDFFLFRPVGAGLLLSYENFS